MFSAADSPLPSCAILCPAMQAQGGRVLQREGSLAASQKKRRVERSSLGAVGAISIDDDAVMSPSASRQLTERVVSSNVNLGRTWDVGGWGLWGVL
jgi:hypothetical protein